MEALRRVRVGSFLLQDSVTLAQLEQLVKEERLSEVLQPVDSVFYALPAGVVTQAGEKFLFNGNPLKEDQLVVLDSGDAHEVPVEGEYAHTLRVYDREKHFIGLYDHHQDKQLYEPRKLFFVGVTGGGR
jgi:tRNA pseudouridine55 synthase